MGTTSRFSIGRDTLVRYVFESHFFDKVPELAEFKPLFEKCRATYQEELAKKGCTCRMTTAWAKDCLTPLLEKVDAAKKTNHDLVRNFIRYVGKYSEGSAVDHVGVTIMYDTNYDIFVDKTETPETVNENANI